MSLTEALRQKIESIIASDDVVLFMKGDRNFPQCGFSATVIQILDSTGTKYTTFNILADPDVRNGVKEFSSWPTIPQLYLKGEFVGGCDIVRDMNQSGELHKMLNVAPPPSKDEIELPTIKITDAAVAVLNDAIQGGNPGDLVHVAISGRYEHSMELGPGNDTGVQIQTNGITVQLDVQSALRANGLTIDFVEGPSGAGFKLDNPGAPAKVIALSPQEFKAKLDSGAIKELLDVRAPEERALAAISGSRLLDDATSDAIASVDKSTPLGFHCHHGMRSMAAAEHFLKLGFTEVYNLTGGIDAWSQTVDPSVPRY